MSKLGKTYKAYIEALAEDIINEANKSVNQAPAEGDDREALIQRFVVEASEWSMYLDLMDAIRDQEREALFARKSADKGYSGRDWLGS